MVNQPYCWIKKHEINRFDLSKSQPQIVCHYAGELGVQDVSIVVILAFGIYNIYNFGSLLFFNCCLDNSCKIVRIGSHILQNYIIFWRSVAKNRRRDTIEIWSTLPLPIQPRFPFDAFMIVAAIPHYVTAVGANKQFSGSSGVGS